MPMVIDYIDKIAREKQRDVLYLEFRHPPGANADDDKGNLFFDYRQCEIRETLLQWFEENHIAVRPCGPFAQEGLLESYRGQLYLDMPFDKSNPDYQKIENLLENEDGSPKFPEVGFFYVKLKDAMKNTHHDEPGYWENMDW